MPLPFQGFFFFNMVKWCIFKVSKSLIQGSRYSKEQGCSQDFFLFGRGGGAKKILINENLNYKLYECRKDSEWLIQGYEIDLYRGNSSDLRRHCRLSYRAPVNRRSACFTWFVWGGVLNQNSSLDRPIGKFRIQIVFKTIKVQIYIQESEYSF